MEARISFIRSIIWLLLMIATIAPQQAAAQAFETGYQAFLSGDFKRARVFLSRGIQQTSDRYDRALMHKLLGITEFNLGSRQRAQTNFRRALQLDPAIRITREETRNREILQLFASTQRSMGRGGRSSQATRQPPRRTGRSGARQMPRQRTPQARQGRQNMRGQQMARQQQSPQNIAYSLMPFGVGQFVQGKTLLGATFALGQAFGLGLYFERRMTANQADQDALDVIDAFESGGSDISDDEFLKFLDESESFVNAARQEATIGLLIFTGVYITSVLEAILNPPPPPRPPAARRRAAIEEAEKNLQPGEQLEHIYLAEPRPAQDQRMFRFHFDWQHSQPRGVVAFNLQLD